MSDEEIEYLGSGIAKAAGQRPVTGIVLNVEKSTNSDAYRLIFNRSEGGIIPIGRRPGTESTNIDPGSALFRCAVVSRKHAKIVFSDNTGLVYITDLNSHHGTHVRKSGQLSSKMLVPELPMMLSDGDVVTFGKTVGRNEECVRPVVARIELLRNPQPFKPLFVPSPASDKSSSGRYGIYVSSGSSDEMLESELEETSKEVSLLSTGATKVLDAMRNIFTEHAAPKLPPIGPWGNITNLPSLKEVLSQTNHIKSRSHSPMDLESPPAEPPVIGSWPSQSDFCEQSAADLAALDRVIFGEPVGSREASPDSLPTPGLDVIDTDPKEPDGLDAQATPSREPSSEAESSASQTTDMSQVVEKLKEDISKLNAHRRKYRSRFNSNVHTISLKLTDYDDRIKELAAQHDSLAEKVDKMPSVDASAITAQLNDIQERFDVLVDVEVPDLQAQVDTIDADMTDLTKKYEEMGDVRERAGELTAEVRSEIETLQGLLEEMNQLRQKARDQMDQALTDVREMSESTIAKIAAELESARRSRALSIPPTSRAGQKRKREDSDDGDDEAAEEEHDDDVTMQDDPSPTVANLAEEPSMIVKEVVVDTPLSACRPRKRLRKVASVFAQTATAVTVGAVVTWSALAFT